MNRLLAKWRLWRAGYCTKHLIQKTTVARRYMNAWSDAYAGKLIRSEEWEKIVSAGYSMLLLYPNPTCDMCDCVRNTQRIARTEEAIKFLSK